MKRLFVLIILILSITILSGCKFHRTTTAGPTVATTTEDPNYIFLSSLLNKNYNHVEISIKDTFSDNSVLNSSYIINTSGNNTEIDYSYETLNKITVSGNSVVIPDEMKKVHTGKATYQNGTLVNNTGDINIKIDKLDIKKINIDLSNFSNVSITSSSFTANVNKSSYLGIDNFSNMVLSISFDLNKILKITLSYYSDGVNTTIEYVL